MFLADTARSQESVCHSLLHASFGRAEAYLIQYCSFFCVFDQSVVQGLIFHILKSFVKTGKMSHHERVHFAVVEDLIQFSKPT